ncbi:MAG: hypothetical protein ABGX00_01605 [Allomuricauda sp.]
MLGTAKRIYQAIPSFLTYPIIRFFSLTPIFSRKHWQNVVELEETLKTESPSNLVGRNLTLLAKEIERIPYYNRNIYTKFKTTPNIGNLVELPFLDNQEVRNFADELIDESVPGYYTSTGGTGGSPLKIYLSNKSYFVDRNHAFMAWSKLGYGRGDLKLTLRGVHLHDKLAHFNPMNNEILINIFLLNDNNIERIVSIINKYNPVFGHGYPSAWYSFALLINKKKIIPEFKLKGIFFASESVSNTKREFVESIFHVKARATYGFSERAGFAFESFESPGEYLVSHVYGLVEIINANGDNVSEGEEGEIVCTGFINEAMPLLRYRTGDYATAKKIDQGLITVICNIKARRDDFILDRLGNKVHAAALIVHPKSQYEFRYIQLFQKTKGFLELKLVPIGEPNKNALMEIQREYQQKLPYITVEAKFSSMEELTITHRGKIPYLVKQYDNR